MSHRIDGILYNPVGYLGNKKFEPLRDNEVPEMFKLESVGTAIWIPGYTFADSWEDDSVVAAIRSFFHAIERDRLRLEIGSVSLNCENIRKFSDRDSKTSRMLAVASETAQARKSFERLGMCTVYAAKDLDGGNEVAPKHLTGLVRDAGMLLTDTRGRMGHIGAKLRISRDWAPFAAVIHCDSQGRESFLRVCENPSHDEIKHDFISDNEDKKKALQAFAELGSWARSVIEKVAAPDPSADKQNVSELSELLPGKKREGEVTSTELTGDTGDALPQPREHESVPKARRESDRGARKRVPRNPPEPPEPPEPPTPRPPKPPKPPAPPRQYVREMFRRVRFRRDPAETHRVTVSFAADGESYSTIQLVAVGEDNREDEVSISHAEWGEESDIVIANGAVDCLPRTPQEGERVQLVLRTREPVDDKCLALSYRRSREK